MTVTATERPDMVLVTRHVGYVVDATTGCWVWQGYLQPTRGETGRGGYGMLTVPRTRRTALAHRYVYEKVNGPVPKGLELDHLCRNRACVNPDHLEPVTRAENILRGRRTKLTAEQVREIRASPQGPTALARQFGVTRVYVQQLRRTLSRRRDAA